MQSKSKLLSGIAVLFLLIAGVVLGKTQFFTGDIASSSAKTEECNYTSWTKVFKGSYGEIPAGGITSGERRPLLTGVTPANINLLRNSIKNGCDVKLQFIPTQVDNGVTAAEAKTYICSITTFYENLAQPNGGGWVKCLYDPYFWIDSRYTGTVLYGEISFSINNSLSPAGVQIDKGYTIKGGRQVGSDYIETDSFFKSGWQESGVTRWGVSVFVKK